MVPQCHIVNRAIANEGFCGLIGCMQGIRLIGVLWLMQAVGNQSSVRLATTNVQRIFLQLSLTVYTNS